MPHEFACDWSYRTPLVTIRYPKGYKGELDPQVLAAARKAKALVTPLTAKRTRKKPA